MYFNFRGFLKALGLALFQTPFRIRRWVYVIGFTILYLAFVILVAAIRQLDRLLFRDIEKTPIVAPVFIIAPPRSGTSFFQKLLTFDEDRFVYWKMYQTILPTLMTERAISSVVRLDHLLGRPMARFLAWCEKRWFGGWDNLHTMRLDAPEEDGALYLYAFACEAIYMLFPYVDELWELGFPDLLPLAERRSLMRYYRTCLQRLTYGAGPGRTLLIKSTNSCGAVRAILDEFPDARFITIVRDPLDSIASSISLMMPALAAHSPEIPKDGAVSEAYARMSIEWYKHLQRFQEDIPASQFHVVDYRTLVKDPKAAVEGVYRHFSWKMSQSFLDRLERQRQTQADFKSSHRYLLEEFGIDRQWVRSELAPVLKKSGFGDLVAESNV